MVEMDLALISIGVDSKSKDFKRTDGQQNITGRNSKMRIDLFLFGLAVLGAGVALFHSAMRSHNLLFVQWFTAIFNVGLFVVGSLAMTAGAAMIYTSLTGQP
ncbi:MAG: hypothetical protein ACLPY5_11785 [Candidatus Bathyarchaeia archaeon]